MGSIKHILKSYGAGLGSAVSGGKKERYIGENVIVRDAKSSGSNQYDKHGSKSNLLDKRIKQ